MAKIYDTTQQNTCQHIDSMVGMRRWTTKIVSHRQKLLEGKGSVSHKQALENAEKKFEIYRAREMWLLKRDFNRAVKGLKK